MLRVLQSSKVGVTIFDAASSPVRMQILRLLSSRGPLSYTEVMSSIKLDPIRDAGKFVYHLKSLMGAGLLQLDKETKKYSIIELGELVVKFARDVEEYVAVKKGKLYVRTSRFAIEEFDRSKITKSLVTEAGVPRDLAEEIAAEAEDRLIRLKTAYLTAPLIREFINAILIEKKLEDYRHKLTRVGMPIYDVSQLFESSSEHMLDVEAVKEAAGSSVIEEYVLLSGLPRDIADAHLSGNIHIDNLSNWILKPNEVQHDLRFFITNGVHPLGVPKNIESALAMVQGIVALARSEVSGEQGFDMLNVFLAPFVKGVPHDRLRELLAVFLAGLDGGNGTRSKASLLLELTIPTILENAPAIGPGGKVSGKYKDYQDESQMFLECLMQAMDELSTSKPLFNPKLIFKLRDNTPQKWVRDRILRIHEFASKYFLPYFMYTKENEEANYTATGRRLSTEWSKDWEADCVRTGNMDTVFLNLPRVAYESRRKDELFTANLEKSVKAAVEALKAKQKAMKERFQQALLPVLSTGPKEEPYYHYKNATYTVSLMGFNEAVMAHTGSSFVRDESSLKFAQNLLRETLSLVKSIADDSGVRFTLGQLPGDGASARLAELDVEKYGLGVTVVEGAKGHPFYTDVPLSPHSAKIALEDRISIESKFQSILTGGHISLIHMSPEVQDPAALMKLTERACAKGLRFFTFTGNFTFCRPCNHTSRGMAGRCAKCGSDVIINYGRSSATYLPTASWPEAKRRAIDRRVGYNVG